MARILPPSDPRFDAHYAAVGHVVDTWAQLEFAMDQAIWDVASVEQMFGACITAQLVGINSRLRALSSLVHMRNGSDATVKSVRSLAGNLRSLQLRRNRAVHDPRYVHKATGQMNRLQVTADNTLVFGWQPESTNELEQLAADITKELKSFYQLYQKIADELKALPDTSQPILHKIVPVIPDESDQAIDP